MYIVTVINRATGNAIKVTTFDNKTEALKEAYWARTAGRDWHTGTVYTDVEVACIEAYTV